MEELPKILTNEMCRTCLKSSENENVRFYSIYDFVDDHLKRRFLIHELLNYTVPILPKIEVLDELPNKICSNCLCNLIAYNEFQNCCLNSDLKLRSAMRSVNVTPCQKRSVSEDPLQCAEIETFVKQETDSEEEEEFIQDHFTQEAQDNAICSQVQDSMLLLKTTYNDTESAMDYQKSLNDSNGNSDICKNNQGNKNSTADESENSDGNDDSSAQKITPKRTENFKMWKCEICLKIFHQRNTLSRHMKGMHNETLPKGTPAVLVNDVGDSKRLSTLFKCDECDRVFQKQHFLNLHKQKHAELIMCQYCDKTFTQRQKLKQHESAHRNERPYLCPDCGKTFCRRYNLNEHKKRHSVEKRYQCSHCPTKFSTGSDLSHHVRQVHNTEKPFACDKCDQAFKQPSQLKKHNAVHTGEKRFKCDFCEKRFRDKDHMARHRRTHTGEKPYKCEHCIRSFSQWTDLIKHLRTHIGENVYHCKLCPAAFRLAGELRTHFASHKNDDEETKKRNKLAWHEAQEQLKLKLESKCSTK